MEKVRILWWMIQVYFKANLDRQVNSKFSPTIMDDFCFLSKLRHMDYKFSLTLLEASSIISSQVRQENMLFSPTIVDDFS